MGLSSLKERFDCPFLGLGVVLGPALLRHLCAPEDLQAVGLRRSPALDCSKPEGARLRCRMATQRPKIRVLRRFWEGFWGRGSQKGSEKGAFSVDFTVKRGSEKGSQKGF